ncbi:MAG TPA: VTT domain-containing protein [Bryobacteraceae bacterium]
MLAKITAALVAYGPWGVVLLGFLDSLGVPLPAAMDALLIFLAVKAPERALIAALMAVIGSLAGNLALFLGIQHGSRLLIKTVPEPGKPQRFRDWFRRYGLVTVFIPAAIPVLPLPLKVFVVSAAYLRTPLRRFLLVILLARVIRYFGDAYLGMRLGAGAQPFLARNAWTLAGIAVAAAAALFLLIHWKSRGRSAV